MDLYTRAAATEWDACGLQAIAQLIDKIGSGAVGFVRVSTRPEVGESIAKDLVGGQILGTMSAKSQYVRGLKQFS